MYGNDVWLVAFLINPIFLASGERVYSNDVLLVAFLINPIFLASGERVYGRHFAQAFVQVVVLSIVIPCAPRARFSTIAAIFLHRTYLREAIDIYFYFSLKQEKRTKLTSSTSHSHGS